MSNINQSGEHPNVVQFSAASPPPEAPPRRSLPGRLQEIRELLAESEPLPEAVSRVPSDEDVVDDRRAFRRRFGIGFDWPRKHRERLIKVKKEFDLTDREIRLFRHTGNLKRTPTGVNLSASRWVATWGWVQLSVFGSLLVILALVTWPNLIAGSPHAWNAVGFMAGIGALCSSIYLTFVMPWQIQKRSTA